MEGKKRGKRLINNIFGEKIIKFIIDIKEEGTEEEKQKTEEEKEEEGGKIEEGENMKRRRGRCERGAELGAEGKARRSSRKRNQQEQEEQEDRKKEKQVGEEKNEGEQEREKTLRKEENEPYVRSKREGGEDEGVWRRNRRKEEQWRRKSS